MPTITQDIPREQPNALDPMLRLNEVRSLTGLSHPAIQRLMRTGAFPPALRLGARAIGWKRSTIDAWLASRPTVLDA